VPSLSFRVRSIAVRAGHHCAQPTMDRYGVAATVRPSLALYNTHDEIEQLARAVHRLSAR
jgi:cysteine desulfurase/selenocysteine lyase